MSKKLVITPVTYCVKTSLGYISKRLPSKYLSKSNTIKYAAKPSI